MADTITDKPMGVVDRVKTAMKVLTTGKTPNPMAGEPEDRSRAALVRELNDWCVDERKFWKPVFDRIRQEQKFSAGAQWINSKKQTTEIEDYIGDLTQQLKNRKTAALYAKNPIPEAVLRDRLNFSVWDGRQETIDACHALIAQVGPVAARAHAAETMRDPNEPPVPPPPPQLESQLAKAQEILEDYNQGMALKARLERVAETGGKLIKQQWDAQTPDMVTMGKRAVTQVITSRVAYIKVLYKRDEASTPTESANTSGFDDKIAMLSQQLSELNDELSGVDNDDPARAESEMLKASLEKQIAEMGAAGTPPPPKEGIVLDWLSATSVIIDRRCTSLKEFVGAHRIAHEILMSVADCEKKFNVNLRDSGARLYSENPDGAAPQEDRTDYQNDDKGMASQDKFRDKKVCVWCIEDKDTGLCYYVCDGVKNFLAEPEDNYPEFNRFWSIVPIVFNTQTVETNDPENDVTIYPRSDIRLMMPMQININIAGQEKRKHRTANRPYWIGVKSKFATTAGTSDLEKLARPRDGHDVLMLENINPGEKIGDFIQPGPKQEFDDHLYDNSQDQNALMLATGMQASDLGEQRPDEKATGQNIAAQQLATTQGSDVDELDFAFSTTAQMCWEANIAEMPLAEVQRRVGRGAIWPEINRQDVADAIFFKIEAGSMGKPNQQAELAKLKVVGPLVQELLQAMGRSPEPLLKLVLKTWDANIDLDQLLQDAQVLPPPQPQAEPQKPPSVSISANLKDLPPTEQADAVQKFYGLKPAGPQEALLNKVGFKEAVKAHHENALHHASKGGMKLDKNNPQHVAIARGFLKLANGNPQAARAMAAQHGYT